jgi:hypothetical protein
MRLLPRVAALVQIAGFLVQPHLRAQQITSVPIGTRVRITIGRTAPSGSGEVVALTRDSLFIATPGEQTRLGFRRVDISRLEVSSGQHRNTLKGLGIGVLAGAGTGVIAGIASGNDSPCVPPPTTPTGTLGIGLGPCDFNLELTAAQKAGIFGVAFGIVGGAIGSITGALIKSDRWVMVSESTAILPLVDGKGRLGLSIRY